LFKLCLNLQSCLRCCVGNELYFFWIVCSSIRGSSKSKFEAMSKRWYEGEVDGSSGIMRGRYQRRICLYVSGFPRPE
jgi:hypothetical protein